MPMIALAAYSVYQGVQASKGAKQDASARNAALQGEQAVGAEEQEYYRQKYGPMNQMLVDYAMGNKPSPYLAAAKGKVETGYQQGVTSLDEMQGIQGLGQSGIGAGQKIGLNMERAKAEAGLDLADQAQRYGVAQSLSGMEGKEQAGAQMAAGALGRQAGYDQADLTASGQMAGAAFQSAASNIGAAATMYGAGLGTPKASPSGPAASGPAGGTLDSGGFNSAAFTPQTQYGVGGSGLVVPGLNK